MKTKGGADVRPQTIYDLLRAAELFRGRRGTGKGTRRALAQLKKEITGRKA
jgi:hypothetical protein